MTILLADCFEIEAALLNLNPDTTISKVDSTASWYAYVLDKFDLSPDQLGEEIQLWQKKPTEWGRLLDSTEQILERRRKEKLNK